MEKNLFKCIGCNHTLPIIFQMKTENYCYLCDPNITLDELLKSTPIQIGCNYHTTWQSNKSMRFVLVEINGEKARLQTRRTKKDFWTNVSDLIFITSGINKQKAKKLNL